LCERCAIFHRVTSWKCHNLEHLLWDRKISYFPVRNCNNIPQNWNWKGKKKNIDIFRMLKHLKVNLWFIGRSLKRYKNTRQGWPKKKTSRKRTVRTKEVVKKVRERFRRKGDRSMRELAKELQPTERPGLFWKRIVNTAHLVHSSWALQRSFSRNWSYQGEFF
jgi:hypothetical protein